MRINNYHLSWQLHGFTTTYDFLLLLLDKLRSKERGTLYIRYKIFYPLQLELLTQELPSYLKGIKTWTIGKGQSLMTNCLDADTPTVSVWFPRPKYWYKEAHSGALFCITFFPFFFYFPLLLRDCNGLWSSPISDVGRPKGTRFRPCEMRPYPLLLSKVRNCWLARSRTSKQNSIYIVLLFFLSVFLLLLLLTILESLIGC